MIVQILAVLAFCAAAALLGSVAGVLLALADSPGGGVSAYRVCRICEGDGENQISVKKSEAFRLIKAYTKVEQGSAPDRWWIRSTCTWCAGSGRCGWGETARRVMADLWPRPRLAIALLLAGAALPMQGCATKRELLREAQGRHAMWLSLKAQDQLRAEQIKALQARLVKLEHALEPACRPNGHGFTCTEPKEGE